METSYYNDPLATHLANHLILKANHKDRLITFNKEKITIFRGQHLTGRKILAKETGINESTIRHKLELLQNVGFLTIKSNNRFSIITILKYDEYQSDQEKKPTIRTAGDRPETTPNNDKNDKNKDTPQTTSSQKKDTEEKVDLKSLINHFSKRYLEGVGFKYTPSYAKDMKTLQTIFAGDKTPEKTVDNFFSLWAEKKDHYDGKVREFWALPTIGLFRTVINEVRAWKPIPKPSYYREL